MANFIDPGYPTDHHGITRLERVIDVARGVTKHFRAASSLAAMLLASGISAVVVVADQVVSTWTDGHLLLAWIALWALVFAVLALFAQASQDLATRLIETLHRWQCERSQRASDEQIWAVAQDDPRFMAELHAMHMRGEQEALASGRPMPVWPFSYMPMRPRRAQWSY